MRSRSGNVTQVTNKAHVQIPSEDPARLLEKGTTRQRLPLGCDAGAACSDRDARNDRYIARTARQRYHEGSGSVCHSSDNSSGVRQRFEFQHCGPKRHSSRKNTTCNQKESSQIAICFLIAFKFHTMHVWSRWRSLRPGYVNFLCLRLIIKHVLF